MTSVDPRRPVLGRWNALDVFIGVVLLALVPLLYAGYLLFRPVQSTLVAVEPSRILARTDVDITVHGTDLRPYMRVSFNERQAFGYTFADASKAMVGASQLPPGVYDVILYDQAQERARLPRAFEVVEPPRRDTELDLVGAFTGASEGQLAQLKVGQSIAGLGAIRELGLPRPSLTRTVLGAGLLVDVPSGGVFNLPAVIRAGCTLTPRSGSVGCVALDTLLMEDVVLKSLDAAGELLFQIDQVRTTAQITQLAVRVRLGGSRAAVERVRIGDRDLRRQNELALAGTVVSLTGARPASPAVAVAMMAPPGNPDLVTVLGDLAVRDAELRVPGQRMADGWSYAGRPLNVGAQLDLHGPGYHLRATILAVTPLAASPQ